MSDERGKACEHICDELIFKRERIAAMQEEIKRLRAENNLLRKLLGQYAPQPKAELREAVRA